MGADGDNCMPVNEASRAALLDSMATLIHRIHHRFK
jgi:hypothetical protein